MMPSILRPQFSKVGSTWWILSQLVFFFPPESQLLTAMFIFQNHENNLTHYLPWRCQCVPSARACVQTPRHNPEGPSGSSCWELLPPHYLLPTRAPAAPHLPKCPQRSCPRRWAVPLAPFAWSSRAASLCPVNTRPHLSGSISGSVERSPSAPSIRQLSLSLMGIPHLIETSFTSPIAGWPHNSLPTLGHFCK